MVVTNSYHIKSNCLSPSLSPTACFTFPSDPSLPPPFRNPLPSQPLPITAPGHCANHWSLCFCYPTGSTSEDIRYRILGPLPCTSVILVQLIALSSQLQPALVCSRPDGSGKASIMIPAVSELPLVPSVHLSRSQAKRHIQFAPPRICLSSSFICPLTPHREG